MFLGQVKDVADCRYHYGLRLDIHLLAFQNFETVDEVVQHALKAEKITVHQAHKLTSHKGISQLSFVTSYKHTYQIKPRNSIKFSI